MAAYGDDLASFAGLAADRCATACDPARACSPARQAHYQAMRDKLLALLRAAPVAPYSHVPKA